MPQKKATQYLQAKIRKIRKEEPDKPMDAVLGKAYGMARGAGHKTPRKKKGK